LIRRPNYMKTLIRELVQFSLKIRLSRVVRSMLLGMREHFFEKFDWRGFVLQVRAIEGHGEEVTSTSFSLDGKRVVSGSLDKLVKIWDVETGALVRDLPSTTF